jgi:uncharacterized protein YndB with AHSA1/START domain
MKWVLIVAGVLVAIIGLTVLVGVLLPQGHVASVSRDYAANPDVVWQSITNVEGFADWRRDIQSVERLPSEHGKPRWRETSKYDALTMEVTESVPSRKLVTRIADEGLPFGGTWTYELSPNASGTRLTITERGEVYNPFFRFVARFIMGHDGTMKKYHEALTAKLSR